ncbi:MAG: collagen-binding domain-containing protein [Phycisphaerales bacterium JB050]
MNKFTKIACAVGAVAFAAGSALATPLSDFNLIVAGDWQTGSNTWGRVAVGGNASGNWTDIGTRLNAGAVAGTDTLIVAGNASNGFNMQAGNARFGGTFTGGFNANGGGSYATNVPGTTELVGGIVSEVRSMSSTLAALPANASFTQSGNAGFFDASGLSGTVVFNIGAAILSSNAFANFSLLNAQNAAAIVINVDTSATSGDANFTAGNFLAQTFSDYADRLVWNFAGADNILVQREVFGAMIGLDAHLHNQANLNGSIAVGSFNQQGEVHWPNFVPEFPEESTLVPLPSAAGMTLAGLAMIGTRRRRA